MADKPKLAVYWAASCGGCEVSILNLDELFLELNTGGIRLMEAMAGYRRAIVVDAMLSGAEPGTVRHFDPRGFVTTKNTCSSHDTDFGTAFQTGLMLGVPLPELVTFWGGRGVGMRRFQ